MHRGISGRHTCFVAEIAGPCVANPGAPAVRAGIAAIVLGCPGLVRQEPEERSLCSSHHAKLLDLHRACGLTGSISALRGSIVLRCVHFSDQPLATDTIFVVCVCAV